MDAGVNCVRDQCMAVVYLRLPVSKLGFGFEFQVPNVLNSASRN